MKNDDRSAELLREEHGRLMDAESRIPSQIVLR